MYYFLQVATLRRGSPLWWWAVASTSAVLAASIIIFNLMALVTLCRSRTTPAHYPLASLAAADLLVGVFVVPLAIHRELYVFDMEWKICAFWKTLDVHCCTASILSLCVLGWERYSGITRPLARARRAKRAKRLALLVWPVSLAVALPTAFMWRPRFEHSGEMERACPENTNVAYVFFSTTLSFYLPATIMLALYAKILLALSAPPQIRSHTGCMASPCRGHSRKKVKKTVTFFVKRNEKSDQPGPPLNSEGNEMSALQGSNLQLPESSNAHPHTSTPLTPSKAQRKTGSRHRRATRAIIRLMGLFLLCWSPFFIMLPIDSLCECLNDMIWETATWLGYINSALNPLVYAVSIIASFRTMRSKLYDATNSTSEESSANQRWLGFFGRKTTNDGRANQNRDVGSELGNRNEPGIRSTMK